ncbi:AcrR family transcriptional regulator [Phycicoccus badiiscoriae]|uniref:AcrR family transcriptional regulator n=1 Tax=Pedococcus badiiscoriae TaxID=642776 RepID=A0A852WCJ1_9MICO|nr:TetR/AcrR family transcriptional regulator [Pedococcus badiiscoriae]NYG06400.1 AcrR family transcriptional regulator [Pedococcus badiiscoriae]
MARYNKEHKEATRKRIIETAGRRFKQDGIDGSGIATLMADAGLTNGAFYAHFDSKDALVATVVGEELGRQAKEFAELPPGRAGLEAFVDWYLSRDHREHPEAGCPSAALLDEIGRTDTEAKRAYTKGAKAILDEISVRLAPEDPDSARGTALALFTMMVGTMQLARAVSDRRLSNAVLEEGIRSAHAMLANA